MWKDREVQKVFTAFDGKRMESSHHHFFHISMEQRRLQGDFIKGDLYKRWG